MSRLLANLIIAGGSMLVKAASQAYQKALVNAQRSGVAQEAAKGTAASMFAKKTMSIEEARMILGIAVLKEPRYPPKIVGVAVMFAGLVLVGAG